MKKVKSVIKSILKVIKCPIILWPLMVVILWRCLLPMGVGSGEKWPGGADLSVERMNAPEQTAYVDVLVKMDRDDPNYVDFTIPPKRLVRENTDEEGWPRVEFVDLPINEESEIAKWREEGYISLTLHHKDVVELRIMENYEKEDGSYIATNEVLEVKGSFRRDFYKKYNNVKVAYVDEEGNVLKVTDKAKKKYIGYSSDNLVVDGDLVVFEIGEAAPWIAVLFYALSILLPLYTIYLIIKFLIFLYKGFFV